jgi:hypothetical protein
MNEDLPVTEAEKSKWRSLMILDVTHAKVKDLAQLHRLPLNQMVEYLVERAWVSSFEAPQPPQKPVSTGFRSKA